MDCSVRPAVLLTLEQTRAHAHAHAFHSTAGSVIDDSNGGSLIDGDLIDLDQPLIKGPLIGKRSGSGPARLSKRVELEGKQSNQ